MANITIYTTRMCGFCLAAKRLLKQKGAEYDEVDVTSDTEARKAMTERASGGRTVPQIFVGERHVGGCDELYALDASGELDRLLAR